MPPVPLPVLPGVYYALAMGLGDSQPISNVFVFQRTPAPSSSAADEASATHVATALASRWSDFIVNVLSDHYIGGTVKCYPLGSPTSPASVSTYSSAGSVSGTDSYRQVAALVRHQVHRRGRGSQGRTFLSPMSSAVTVASGDELEATFQASCQTDFGNLISRTLSDIVTAEGGSPSWAYVSLSKKGSGAVYPIVSSIVDLQVASIRSRHRR